MVARAKTKLYALSFVIVNQTLFGIMLFYYGFVYIFHMLLFCQAVSLFVMFLLAVVGMFMYFAVITLLSSKKTCSNNIYKTISIFGVHAVLLNQKLKKSYCYTFNNVNKYKITHIKYVQTLTFLGLS